MPSLAWNIPYTWTVTATDGTSSTTVGPVTLTAQVPQPDITSTLGATSSVSGSQLAFDPLTGNYTTSATDAAVPSSGPPLEIDRTYNSLNTSARGAFGDGWSSALDASVTADSDGSGNVVVTLPGGQQTRFGANQNGTYSAPAGSPDVLALNSDGTWSLVVAGGKRYDFAASGRLSGISTPDGRGLTFAAGSSGQVTTITDRTSGRALHISWSTPTGASYPHVASVFTDSPVSGQSGFTWTYSYSGDELTQVCDPNANCTGYSYGATASPYRDAVLDQGPRSYWQLGDGSGTTAADEVAQNLGTTDGTYSNVTLGAPGPLAGDSETAASFNGTSSSVSLPSGQIAEDTAVSVGLWFKVASSQVGGVLLGYAADKLSSSSGNTDHHVPALYVGGDGRLYGEFWNGSIDPIRTTASVADGNWHYAVLTADSTTQSLYLDGSLVGTLSGQVDQQNMTSDTVGAGFWGGGWPADFITAGVTAENAPIGYFDGSIGQVAVYAHSLGQPAIAAGYALGNSTSPLLTKVTMPSGNIAAQVSYDSATDRVSGYTDQHGGQWQVHQPVDTGYKATSDSLAEVLRSVTVGDPAGHDEVYEYDVINGGRLVSYSNGVDPPRTFGYDGAGFLNSVTDQDGNLVTLTNNIHGDVLSRTWYPVQPGTSGAAARPAASRAAALASAPCTTTGTPCTSYYSYYYNTLNPLDPRNNEPLTSADARSESASDTTYQTTYAYNAAGQLTSVTSPATSDFPNGRTTTYSYSTGTETAYGGGTVPAGLQLSQTTPGGAVTSYAYYSDGDLAKVTEPSGRYTVYTYDGLGRPAASTTYSTSYPSGLTTSYAYDPLGRPLTVTYPGATDTVTTATHTLQDSYAYDADGNLITSTQSDTTGGGGSRVTTYVYNDHDELAARIDPAGATSGGSTQTEGAPSPNPQGAATAYTYDPSGNVSSMTDAGGNTYAYAYNEYNEVTQVTLHTTDTSQASALEGCKSPGTQDPNGGFDIALDCYSYDPAGLLASVTDALGRTTSYAYDYNQDLIAVTTTDASQTPSVGAQDTYTYDGAGNVIAKAVTAMSGGTAGTSTVTDYTVDPAGRVTSVVADPTPAGTSASGYANRITSYTYDADNHVTSATLSDGSLSSTVSYGYDIAGNLVRQTVQDSPVNQVTTWTYDQNGQVASMTTPQGNVSGGTPANYTTSYVYDKAGNLSTVTGPPVRVQTYASQSPATSRPVTRYGYDAYGD